MQIVIIINLSSFKMRSASVIFAALLSLTLGAPQNLGLSSNLGLGKNLGLSNGLGLNNAVGLSRSIGLSNNVGIGNSFALSSNVGLSNGLGLNNNLGLLMLPFKMCCSMTNTCLSNIKFLSLLLKKLSPKYFYKT